MMLVGKVVTNRLKSSHKPFWGQIKEVKKLIVILSITMSYSDWLQMVK